VGWLKRRAGLGLAVRSKRKDRDRAKRIDGSEEPFGEEGSNRVGSRSR
jgi:hypothetical protein